MDTERTPESAEELTNAIPREKLPPTSSSNVAALDLDPDHPETIELLARARAADAERETLIPCPACATCSCCDGVGLVPYSRAATWHAENAK